MTYLEKSHIESACKKMKGFYDQLQDLYSGFDLDLEENRGRRNILMSQPMEHFVAQELRPFFKEVINDGRTGKADILIKNDEEEIELECKLTSPHSSGTVAFQSDYDTLQKKGSLDYIYIVANETFDGFCAIHFSGLTTEDFRDLSTGARGKVQMYKWKGMKKAKVLLGDVVNNLETRISAKTDLIGKVFRTNWEKRDKWIKAIEDLSEGQQYERKKLQGQIERLNKNTNTRINKIMKDIRMLEERNPSYTIKFEALK